MAKPSVHCTFCDLLRGAGEVSVCYEDSVAVAFMDIQPVNLGHTLVVPRTHYEGLNDIPRDVAMHLFDVAMRVNVLFAYHRNSYVPAPIGALKISTAPVVPCAGAVRSPFMYSHPT